MRRFQKGRTTSKARPDSMEQLECRKIMFDELWKQFGLSDWWEAHCSCGCWIVYTSFIVNGVVRYFWSTWKLEKAFLESSRGHYGQDIPCMSARFIDFTGVHPTYNSFPANLRSLLKHRLGFIRAKRQKLGERHLNNIFQNMQMARKDE